MKNTYHLKLTYYKTLNLHSITSLVESVKEVRILSLNFISGGKSVAGELILEAADTPYYKLVVKLMPAKNEVFVDELSIAC